MVNSNRRKRKAELTRELLKKAFIELILENNDSETITISEITNRADFDRGTFYTHYQDKIDLLEDLYLDAIKGIRQSYIESYKDMNKIFINEDTSTKLIFDHIEKNKKLFKCLDLIGGDPDIYNRLEDFLWSIFTNKIQLEQKTNSLNADYEILLSFQIHATLGVMKYWIRKDFIYPATYMTEQMITLYKNNVIALSFKKFFS